MSAALQLKEVLYAVDNNLKSLWDELDEEQQKKITFFTLNRYISSVSGVSRERQEHFVLTVNEYFNKHFFTIAKHPKLLWMLLCMCNYDAGKTTFFHKWIGLAKDKTDNKKLNFLKTIYPDAKINDLETLAAVLSNKEVKNLAKEYGLTDQQIKQML